MSTSLHRCRRGGGHRTASWHPTIDVDVERYEIEQRLKRLEKEDERLEELSSKLSAILSSSDTSSNPPNATPGESEM